MNDATFLSEEYSRDCIFNSNTLLIQKKNGYRFSSDSLLLSWFVFEKTLNKKGFSSCLEIGSGNGVVPITMKRRGFSLPITCVEIQDSLFSMLSQNIEKNNMTDSIKPIHGNFLELNLTPLSFDIIFCNPPYFSCDNGKISENIEKAHARHEFLGDIDSFFKKSYTLLKRKGMFFMVYPIKKLHYALYSAYSNNLFCKDILFIKETEQAESSIFLASFIKGESKNMISSNGFIVMKDSDGNYTDIGKRIMYDLS